MIKTDPVEIWGEYQYLTEYLRRHNVYEIVKKNEKFYEGDQWDGLESKNMPTPVFNILQRAGKFMVATLGSNDVAISMTPFTEIYEETKRIEPVQHELENIIELARIKEKSKEIIRNAFVDGSGYLMLSFDPDYETNQLVKGKLEASVIDNTNVYFGNPYSRDIQKQPYIIVAFRQYVGQVREEAKSLGLPEDVIESIREDSDTDQANMTQSENLITVLIKYYKAEKTLVEEKEIMGEDGNVVIQKTEKKIKTVYMTKTTSNVVLIPPTDLEYKRYPISCFGWDIIKNSYLYTSPMTAVIPNQIFVNKCFAIAQMCGLQTAFPKIVYDKNKMDIEDFLNSSASAVAGVDIMGKFLDFIKVPDFSDNIIQLAQETIIQTKDTMGVTEAALGNVKAENTSAIIALQESSAVPLEIQRQLFFEFWEDTIRNMIDVVSCTYGVRQFMTEEEGLGEIDFSMLRDLNYNLKVEIGNGAQFSEIAQINTLDKLVQAGYVQPDVYMEAIPSKYLPAKSKLIKSYREFVMGGGIPVSKGSTPANDTTPI